MCLLVLLGLPKIRMESVADETEDKKDDDDSGSPGSVGGGGGVKGGGSALSLLDGGGLDGKHIGRFSLQCLLFETLRVFLHALQVDFSSPLYVLLFCP